MKKEQERKVQNSEIEKEKKEETSHTTRKKESEEDGGFRSRMALQGWQNKDSMA